MTQDTKVDWGKPIYAVDHNGEVAEAVVIKTQDNGCAEIRISGSVAAWIAWPNGTIMGSGWHIRNVIEVMEQPTPTNEVRERMEALEELCRDLAAPAPLNHSRFIALSERAEALLASASTELVDPLLIAAREAAAAYFEEDDQPGIASGIRAGREDHMSQVAIAYSALRALAEAGK